MRLWRAEAPPSGHASGSGDRDGWAARDRAGRSGAPGGAKHEDDRDLSRPAGPVDVGRAAGCSAGAGSTTTQGRGARLIMAGT